MLKRSAHPVQSTIAKLAKDNRKNCKEAYGPATRKDAPKEH